MLDKSSSSHSSKVECLSLAQIIWPVLMTSTLVLGGRYPAVSPIGIVVCVFIYFMFFSSISYLRTPANGPMRSIRRSVCRCKRISKA